jgi:hypothetical protein
MMMMIAVAEVVSTVGVENYPPPKISSTRAGKFDWF